MRFDAFSAGVFSRTVPGSGPGSHPDELLQPSVPRQNFFVEFHSFQVSTAEL